MRIVRALALLTLAVAGCGGLHDEPQRVPVAGQVTYDGRPVADGRIRFEPAGRTKGPVSGGAIADGRFLIDHKGGVPVGRQRVHIEAYRTVEHARPDPVEGPLRVQFLPERYNVNSTLEIAIKPGTSEIDRDFPLTSDP